MKQGKLKVADKAYKDFEGDYTKVLLEEFFPDKVDEYYEEEFEMSIDNYPGMYNDGLVNIGKLMEVLKEQKENGMNYVNFDFHEDHRELNITLLKIIKL